MCRINRFTGCLGDHEMFYRRGQSARRKGWRWIVIKMKSQLLWLVASAISTGAATPIRRASDTAYFFTFGDSYSQTGFSTSGEQPSASNPMGNPAL
ncbi:uncharacterized protein P174DRAFT_404460, partial [Aspergillus novofumigatus IBT 16806]